MFELLIDQSPPVLLGGFESFQGYSLAIGICGLIAGIMMFINHRRHWEEVVGTESDQRIVKFELRKFRRRSIVSAMIASVGCMMAALYWVTDSRVLAIFVLLTMGLLVAILGVAMIDMFSVGLQQIATPDPKAEKAMIEEYLRQREKLSENQDSD